MDVSLCRKKILGHTIYAGTIYAGTVYAGNLSMQELFLLIFDVVNVLTQLPLFIHPGYKIYILNVFFKGTCYSTGLLLRT